MLTKYDQNMNAILEGGMAGVWDPCDDHHHDKYRTEAIGEMDVVETDGLSLGLCSSAHLIYRLKNGEIFTSQF